jgi:hypothetical protein
MELNFAQIYHRYVCSIEESEYSVILPEVSTDEEVYEDDGDSTEVLTHY